MSAGTIRASNTALGPYCSTKPCATDHASADTGRSLSLPGTMGRGGTSGIDPELDGFAFSEARLGPPSVGRIDTCQSRRLGQGGIREERHPEGQLSRHKSVRDIAEVVVGEVAPGDRSCRPVDDRIRQMVVTGH